MLTSTRSMHYALRTTRSPQKLASPNHSKLPADTSRALRQTPPLKLAMASPHRERRGEADEVCPNPHSIIPFIQGGNRNIDIYHRQESSEQTHFPNFSGRKYRPTTTDTVPSPFPFPDPPCVVPVSLNPPVTAPFPAWRRLVRPPPQGRRAFCKSLSTTVSYLRWIIFSIVFLDKLLPWIYASNITTLRSHESEYISRG